MSKEVFSTIDSSELSDVVGGLSWPSLDYPGKSYYSGGGGGGAGGQEPGPPTETDRSIKIGWEGFGFEAHNHTKYAPPKS